MTNNIKYINEYNRLHYKQFKANIYPEDMGKLNRLLKELKMNKAEFIRWAIDRLMIDFKK